MSDASQLSDEMNFLFLWQGFMKGTMLEMKGQFYEMDENSE